MICSGGGSNLQAILDAIDVGDIAGEVVLVLANRKSAFALERARSRGIPARFLSRKQLGAHYDAQMLEALMSAQTDLVVLAGYLAMVGRDVVTVYQGRMMNIHPALLPAFGGQGMYGHHVHEAVIAYGAKVSGATVHFVDEQFDHGPVIAQQTVPVLETDDAQALADRVLAVEHQILPLCVRAFCDEKIRVDGRRVRVLQ